MMDYMENQMTYEANRTYWEIGDDGDGIQEQLAELVNQTAIEAAVDAISNLSLGLGLNNKAKGGMHVYASNIALSEVLVDEEDVPRKTKSLIEMLEIFAAGHDDIWPAVKEILLEDIEAIN